MLKRIKELSLHEARRTLSSAYPSPGPSKSSTRLFSRLLAYLECIE